MYCKRCFAELPLAPKGAIDRPDRPADLDPKSPTIDYATDYSYACAQCGKVFDPNRPPTYLRRRFPAYWQIALMFTLTTFFGIACAWVVSIHQLAAMSGH